MHALHHTSSHSVALLPALHCHIHAYHHLACSTYHSHTHIALFMHECSYTHFVEHFHQYSKIICSSFLCNIESYYNSCPEPPPSPMYTTPHPSLSPPFNPRTQGVYKKGWVGGNFLPYSHEVVRLCDLLAESGKTIYKNPSYLSTCHSVLFSALPRFLIRLMHAHSACIPLPPYRGSCLHTCLVQKQFYSHCRG